MVSLGGALLGITTIAGLLMVYQVRQTNDALLSAKAIFAADAGLEWGLYNYYCATSVARAGAQGGFAPGECPHASKLFTNGASVEVACIDDAGTRHECDPPPPNVLITRIVSVGRAGTASRAFEIEF